MSNRKEVGLKRSAAILGLGKAQESLNTLEVTSYGVLTQSWVCPDLRAYLDQTRAEICLYAENSIGIRTRTHKTVAARNFFFFFFISLKDNGRAFLEPLSLFADIHTSSGKTAEAELYRQLLPENNIRHTWIARATVCRRKL